MHSKQFWEWNCQKLETCWFQFLISYNSQISSKVANPVNKVIVAVLGVDKLQTILKPKLLGKTEFHLHKLAKVNF